VTGKPETTLLVFIFLSLAPMNRAAGAAGARTVTVTGTGLLAADCINTQTMEGP